ncbi:hypothetical protein PTKIN_Ptkin08bG0028000 [Pterospermum kingtungense]
MKKKETGQRRGFGFVTYADPSVVDKVIKDIHIINGKQVQIKRPIQKGALGTKVFKTKRIFVGGIPSRVSEDEFKDFFSQFGEVNEYQVMHDHTTGGFDDLLAKSNKVELAGAQVEIKRMPNKQIPLPTPLELQGDPGNAYDGYEDSYDGYHGDRFDYIGYRSSGSALHWGGAAGHSGHDGVEFGSYRGYHSAMELFGEEPFHEYLDHRGRGEFGLYEEYRRERSFEYSCRHGGREFGSGMEPYKGEPSFEYSGHQGGHECGRLKCHGGGVEPYWAEPPEYLRQVEGGHFGMYGGAMELYRDEPFHEYSSHSRGGLDRGYDVQHGYVSPSEIYGENGAGGGYRGGAGGPSLGYRDGEGGARRGRRYHPYAW